MDKDMENRQNFLMDNNSMQNLNLASAGDGLLGVVQAEVVSGVAGEILGGKYDEHHEELKNDDDELKYVEEVQQSEKQQQQQLQALKNFGLNDDGTYESNELLDKETSNNVAYGFGNGNGRFVFGGDNQIYQQQPQHDLFNLGNGHDTNGHDNADFGNLISKGFEEKLNLMESDLDGFKNEGDLSSTSNITESVEGLVPQIDVKIEPKVEQQEMLDEEEPSSLATNTTNGTSSLSENIPPPSLVTPQANAFGDFATNLEDKENTDPLTPKRPNDLDLEQAHSQLNPDAKEFVPNFGSNPASPTSPFKTVMQQDDPVLSDMETEMYFAQVPRAVPRQLLDDDDFVAQSPRKGKGDNDMDEVSVPTEVSEFEQEADKRPHELEPEVNDGIHQRDDVMTPDQATQQLPLDDLETQDKGNQLPSESIDYQPLNFMDHGPESSVDPESDLDIQTSTVLSAIQGEDDVMKRSMYVASDDAIENVLNSVQPIPRDIYSPNISFNEESATESAAIPLVCNKELLQVEEKEHVSHSASIEEIDMNLMNAFDSSNKDIPHLPIDIENINNMQDSIYMKQEDHVQQVQEQIEELLAEEPFEEDQMFHEQQQLSEAASQPSALLDCEQQPQVFQKELQNDNHSDPEIPQFHEEIQYQEKIKISQAELDHGHQTQEVEEQQLLEESPKILIETHHDKQPTQDPIINAPTSEVDEESLLDDATNPLIYNDSLNNDAFDNQEVQQETTEAFSPIKVTEEISNTLAIESIKSDAPTNNQEPSLDVFVNHHEANLDAFANIASSFTAAEKHLLEETKEQQLFSLSGLEQQMSGLMLNNTDGHLSQAEEVATTTAAIEDISENLITPDEAVEQKEEYQHQQEQEKSQDNIFIDDSFNRHEQECLQHEQEMDIEINEQTETETKAELVHESIETSAEQQHQQELESEKFVVEEPIIEAKEAEQLFTIEETETVNITKTEERQEIPPCMIPEIAPVEQLEPSMTIQNETEIVKSEEETAQQVTESEDKSETSKEPVVKEVKAKEVDALKEEGNTTTEITPDVPVEAAIVAATAAFATTAAVAATAVSSSPSNNKTETEKKPLSKTASTAAKTKVASAPAAKKPVETAKKPVSLAAKPRTAAAKPAAMAADKKTIGKTSGATTTTAARKPLSATTTTASKVMAKTSTSTTRTVTAAPKTTTSSKPTTAPRTVSSSTTTARKPAATNGPLTKPRPSSAPTKPTTLGLSATNGAPKAKPISPRATLTSQVRKTTPATTAAKSPVKTTGANCVTKTASSTLASRTKTTTSTVSSTAGAASKTFTARPAPKFTSSSSTTTTTTTTRRSGGGSTMTTTTTTKNSTPLRKSSPTKSAAGKTPTKPTTPAGGSKSKTITKADYPSGKPAPIRKPVDHSAVIINGEANASKELNGTAEKITAPAEEQHQTSIENGDLQAVQVGQQQNYDSSIPMQTEKQQQSYLESKNDQIPMDLINA